MKALRLEGWHSPAVLRDVDTPVPGPGEVLLQVGGAGACHSDLHLMHEFSDGQLPWSPPFTLGHENAGWVHTLGPGVTGLEPGQPVAVVGARGCGTCARCRADLETYCDHPERTTAPGGGGGLGLDGGMAEYLLVPDARHLVALPDGLDPVHAAPLTDAALTPYDAVTYEVSVQSTYWGNRHELVEVLDLAARGLVRAEVRMFGLEEAVTAYELLEAGAIDGRAVIVPNTEYQS